MARELQLSFPAGSLDAYIGAVNRIPMLTVQEETELAERLQKDDDLQAARRLVMSHLRFVVRLARGYSGYGLAQSDLIQEGNIGLMKAVKRFDPTRGVRLVSFAVHWIRAEIHEFILRNWRIVRVATTKAQRKLFFNLRSSKKRLGWMNQEEAEAMAADLNVKTKDVLEMEQRLSAHDAAFEGSADDESGLSPASFLTDSALTPEESLEEAQTEHDEVTQMTYAITLLDDRSRDIMTRRWLLENKSTLQELAKEYQVSAERIRQIESVAMAKIREHLKKEGIRQK